MKSGRKADNGKPAGDPLAVERTAMANERTLLSYVRTAIMLFATSVTVLYLSKDTVMTAISLAIFATALFTAVFGVWRHRRLQRKIASEAGRSSSDE
ncbi:MAG: DUF202 domain-containing protein [bacterium]